MDAKYKFSVCSVNNVLHCVLFHSTSYFFADAEIIHVYTQQFMLLLRKHTTHLNCLTFIINSTIVSGS